MKKFKTKTKKNKIIKIIIIIFIVYYLFSITTNYIVNTYFKDNFKYTLLKNSTNNLIDIDNNPSSPKLFLLIKKGFNNLINIPSSTLKDEEYIIDNYETETSYIKDPNKTIVNKPLIYIYNTHQLETYSSKYLSEYNIKYNVLMASYMLKEKLNELNLNTIVEESNISDILKTNAWPYSYSYKVSRMFIESTLEKYPSIKILIDLHRDSSSKEKTTTLINGENYAKVLFVVGLDHENYKDNLETATLLNNIIKSKHKSLSRGIYSKGGEGVNGIYNQDISKYSILLELGGQHNTIDEVENTINIVANSIKELYEATYGT